MEPAQIQLIRDSFPKVAAIARPAASLFYARLFLIDPSVRALFTHTDMEQQGDKLMAALGFVVASLDRLDELVPMAEAMARRHVGYGVQPAHYASVGSALLWTLEQGLGEAYTPALRAAWTQAYNTLAGVMIAASAERDAA